MLSIAIIGSRNIKDFELSSHVPADASRVVSGGAAGVDTLAREFAISHGLELVEFLPQYSKFGRSAPIIRNKQIVEAADVVLAVWDGVSRGTAFTIEYAEKLGKQVIIVSP